MMGWYYGGGGFYYLIHLIINGVVIAAVAAGIYYLVKGASEKRTSPVKTTEPPALEVLKLRYAKGEISEDEFLRMKQNLS